MEEMIPGEPFSSHDPQATYGEGRTCSARGCKTILSRYTPTDRCSVHMHAKMKIPK